MKHKEKTVLSIYDKIIRDVNCPSQRSLNELNGCLKVDKQTKGRKVNVNSKVNTIEQKMYLNSLNTERKEDYIDELNLDKNMNSSLAFIPKRKLKFTPSNLMSYSNPNSYMKKFNNAVEKDVEERTSLPFPVFTPSYHGLDNGSSGVNGENKIQTPPAISNNANIDSLPVHNPSDSADFLTFKTNYILKFARNIENYEKLYKYLEIISENNKKPAMDNFIKLKSIADKKDRALFDTNNTLGRDSIILFYEFEVFWLKLIEIVMRELKSLKDINVQLTKKASDQENLIKLKENEIKYLNTFIENNDLNYKSLVRKKRTKDVNEIKDEYERKEKLSMINTFRLEEEIRDLTSLLDKDKEFYTKYHESLEQIEQKKREIEDLRIKFNQESEEKKLKIAYLNNEKHELNQKINVLEKELREFKDIFENSKKEYIEFHTQIKILKQGLQERNENINMLTEEVETWMSELYKERLSHYNTQQTVTALEIKLQSVRKDKPHPTVH